MQTVRTRPMIGALGALLFLLACGDDDSAPSDAGIDAAAPDLGPPPEWPGTFVGTDTLGERRGRSIARTIVHIHSPLSHDACDGEGWVDGELADATCLEHFRDAVCALRMDALFLTDHVPHVDEVDFSGGLWVGEPFGAEPIMDGEAIVASRLTCDDGHEVLLTLGSENELMPLALDRHPDGDPLADGYEGSTPEVIAGLRDAGGLIWAAHTEEKDLDWLRRVEVDGLELYNLHANVDPTIRSESLGLDPAPFLGQLLSFTRSSLRLAPDLAVMTFLDPNRVALERWDTLLAEGRHVVGTGGCDAHENAFPQLLTDGERADSYRRMMSWITNHLLVDERTPAAYEAALAAGRVFAVFEFFGTPQGLDFVAEEGGTSYEMGETAPVGATIRAPLPAITVPRSEDPTPTVSLHLLRAEAGGAVEVASSTDADLEHTTTEAGVYRLEIRIVPEHTRPYLNRLADDLIRELPWAYSNPIYVE